MPIAQSRITAQGQISVPAGVRKKLGIGPGSVLEWVEKEGGILVRRAGRYTSTDIHQALFAEKPTRRSLEELKAGPRQAAKREHARD